MQKRVVISLNTTWNLVNFRSGLIKSLIENGYQVVAVAPADSYVNQLMKLGCKYVDVKIKANSTNALDDIFLLWQYLKILYEYKPDVYLSFTPKPNIYGSIAAQILNIRTVNNIAGRNSLLHQGKIVVKILEKLYWLSLRNSFKVFFQNKEDMIDFQRKKLVREEISDLLPGSGVNTRFFHYIDFPIGKRFRFLFVGRMLKEKGVIEFIKAAKIVKEKGYSADFFMIGEFIEGAKNSLSNKQIQKWVDEGYVNYLGMIDNVHAELGLAHCIVLPTYYGEGTPKTLLEAGATGRPILTTDWPGCRDVVDSGINGLLCLPKDPLDLAEKMVDLLSLNNTDLKNMGIRGREKIVKEFDEAIVIKKYLECVSEILNADQ